MASQRAYTTDHETIRRWAEARDGKPATVKRTESNGEPGILRINFPGYAEDSLEDISWDDFFEKFDEKHLAMLYQDETSDGQQSRFCKFVSRETAENADSHSSKSGRDGGGDSTGGKSDKSDKSDRAEHKGSAAHAKHVNHKDESSHVQHA